MSELGKSLLDMRLPFGKRLSEATREEVLEAARVFGKLARDAETKRELLLEEAKRYDRWPK